MHDFFTQANPEVQRAKQEPICSLHRPDKGLRHSQPRGSLKDTILFRLPPKGPDHHPSTP